MIHPAERERMLAHLDAAGLTVLPEDSDNAQVIARLNNLLAEDPNNYIACFLCGVIYHRRNNFVQAADFYEKALRIKPEYFHALHNLAVIRRVSGELAEAEILLMRCLQLRSNVPQVLYNLGIVRMMRGEYGEAQKISETLKQQDQFLAGHLHSALTDYLEPEP